MMVLLSARTAEPAARWTHDWKCTPIMGSNRRGNRVGRRSNFASAINVSDAVTNVRFWALLLQSLRRGCWCLSTVVAKFFYLHCGPANASPWQVL